MTLEEADKVIVESHGKDFGISDVDSLRKRLQRARKDRRTKI
jgi:hypothetical protein